MNRTHTSAIVLLLAAAAAAAYEQEEGNALTEETVAIAAKEDRSTSQSWLRELLAWSSGRLSRRRVVRT